MSDTQTRPKFDREFRLMLDLFMASDPSPLSAEADEELRKLLDRRAQKFGYDGWVEAFHRLPEGRCRKPMWWGTGMPAGHCGEPSWGNNYNHPRRTNPMDWNVPHGKEMSRYHPLPLACPKHGGPPDPALQEADE